jgi:hypothetical protein
MIWHDWNDDADGIFTREIVPDVSVCDLGNVPRRLRQRRDVGIQAVGNGQTRWIVSAAVNAWA